MSLSVEVKAYKSDKIIQRGHNKKFSFAEVFIRLGPKLVRASKL